MVTKVYMPDEYRAGGGTTFHVPWSRIEDFLRGREDKLAGMNANIRDDETAEFVIVETGISVYVKNVDSR